MQTTADLFPQSSKVLTVAELTRSIRGTLETKFGAVWVQGEISNYKLHPSGHQYFTLKDQRAQIACVIFRNTMAVPRQPIVDGTQVQVYGNVSVFEARGQYQLSVQILQPRGLGLLQAKFEALKRKLEAEGLFSQERKRALPKFPKRIGIVTSPSGAAIRDILNVLQRRAPWLQILINPVRVQGTGAAAEIAVAIRELATPNPLWSRLDLIVVARGGGSIEDLWEFNEETVARTIADVEIPVVSAIGHEIDFTIADFVADLRAPTPSAAAELIVPDIIDLQRRIDELRNCLHKCLRNFIEHEKTRLRFLSERALARELLKRMRDAQQQLDLSRETLRRHIAHRIDLSKRALIHIAATLQSRSPARELLLRRNRFVDIRRRFSDLPARVLQNARHRFHETEAILRVLGPDATLRRGYSITTDDKGKLIRTVTAVRSSMKVRTRLADGEFESNVL
ncbi:MAG: exodeoxyribonuclease large subunit [Verrucomicrobiota bacterium]|jgi:exodeoxyribonuclease VII large subunit